MAGRFLPRLEDRPPDRPAPASPRAITRRPLEEAGEPLAAMRRPILIKAGKGTSLSLRDASYC